MKSWVAGVCIAAGAGVGFGSGWISGASVREREVREEHALLAEEAQRAADAQKAVEEAARLAALNAGPTPEQVANVRIDGPSWLGVMSTCSLPIWNGSDYSFDRRKATMEWTIRHKADGRIERRITAAEIGRGGDIPFAPNQGSTLSSDQLRTSVETSYDIVSCRPAAFDGVPYPHGASEG